MGNSFEDSLKSIFLAGVGAAALTGEKAKELVNTLIEKGELTIEQGKEINQELQHKGEDALAQLRNDALERVIANMSDEERQAFAKRVNDLVAAPQQPSGSQRSGGEAASE